MEFDARRIHVALQEGRSTERKECVIYVPLNGATLIAVKLMILYRADGFLIPTVLNIITIKDS